MRRNKKMENLKIEVGMKCEQVEVIDEYGFNYVGEEFEITKVTEAVVMCKGAGVGFGIEREKFSSYFKLIHENKNINDEYYTESTDVKVDKVIQSGVATVVILSDGSKGISKCLPEDTYDQELGYQIALTKAQIKSLTKKLKRLSK
jgi:hypothetical protein